MTSRIIALLIFLCWTPAAFAQWKHPLGFQPDERIEKACAKQFALDSAGLDGKTRVERAIEKGSLEELIALEKAGAYIPLQRSLLKSNRLGHYDIFLWLVRMGAQHEYLFEQHNLLEITFSEAIASGNTNLVKWWLERAPALRSSKYHKVSNYYDQACGSGNLKMLELVQKTFRFSRKEEDISLLFLFISGGHQKKFQEQYTKVRHKLTNDIKVQLFSEAIRKNNLVSAKWIATKANIFSLLSKRDSFFLMNEAVTTDNPNLIAWLYSQGFSIESIRPERFSEKNMSVVVQGVPLAETYLGLALDQGKCEVAHWLYRKGLRVSNSTDANWASAIYSPCNQSQKFAPHSVPLDAPCLPNRWWLTDISSQVFFEKYNCVQYLVQNGYPAYLQDDLGGRNIVFDNPAQNGIHDLAFGFVWQKIREGKNALELYWQIVKKLISVPVTN